MKSNYILREVLGSQCMDLDGHVHFVMLGTQAISSPSSRHTHTLTLLSSQLTPTPVCQHLVTILWQNCDICDVLTTNPRNSEKSQIIIKFQTFVRCSEHMNKTSK